MLVWLSHRDVHRSGMLESVALEVAYRRTGACQGHQIPNLQAFRVPIPAYHGVLDKHHLHLSFQLQGSISDKLQSGLYGEFVRNVFQCGLGSMVSRNRPSGEVVAG